MDTVLLTGTTGFVGSHLADALRPSYHVVELNRRHSSSNGNSLIWDFHSPLGSNLPHDIDVLVHCASPVGLGPEVDQQACVNVNVGATAQLLAFARRVGVRLFVFLSTGAVYGLRPDPRCEADALKPVGAYACAKAAAEFLVRAYEPHMQTLCLRLFYPYGPGQRLPRLIPRLIEQIKAGKPVSLNGSQGRPRMNPLFIRDLVRWGTRLLEANSSATYNLGGSETVSVRELAERLATLPGRRVCFEYRDPVPADSLAKIDHVCRVTGLYPQWTLDRGLSETVRAYQETAT